MIDHIHSRKSLKKRNLKGVLKRFNIGSKSMLRMGSSWLNRVFTS